MRHTSSNPRTVVGLRVCVAALSIVAACSSDVQQIAAPSQQATPDSIQTPQTPLTPKVIEPAGFTPIATTDFSILPWDMPWDSTSVGRTSGGSNPGALETIVSDVSVSAKGVGITYAFQHIIEAGTNAGYGERDGHYALFNMWDLGMPEGANGGPSDTEYSAFYQSTYFNVFGNGTTIETPPPGIKVLGYWGVANNNQDIYGIGPTQLYALFVPVAGSPTSPLTATAFTIDMVTQNGTNIRFPQNLNASTRVKVGQTHRFEQVLTLGTAGHADGTWDWWLDGVQIGHYTNVPFIDSHFAANGGDGLSGFWGWQFSPIWGGSGGAAKTRNDVIYLGATRISGTFLRNRL